MAARTFRGDEDAPAQMTGFDVVVETVVGHVDLTAFGDHHPHVAAFMIIAEHDGEGTFRFPMQSGASCEVVVSHLDPPVAEHS